MWNIDYIKYAEFWSMEITFPDMRMSVVPNCLFLTHINICGISAMRPVVSIVTLKHFGAALSY